ncbi:hypothetical protein ABZX92_29775 [Lentzea sp. NPDC006480]|uniref:hypothetical protein n=1 Tax=Lentzea sp. NPDC006480 TaxID=3157176 RepID=UPI0033AABB43
MISAALDSTCLFIVPSPTGHAHSLAPRPPVLAERCERGTPRREVPALARDDGTLLAAGYPYLAKVIDLQAEQAPDLHDVLRQAKTPCLRWTPRS